MGCTWSEPKRAAKRACASGLIGCSRKNRIWCSINSSLSWLMADCGRSWEISIPLTMAPSARDVRVILMVIFNPLHQVAQRCHVFLVVAPASDRCSRDLLTHLPFAGSDDDPVGLMKLQTLRIPRQTDELEH